MNRKFLKLTALFLVLLLPMLTLSAAAATVIIDDVEIDMDSLPLITVGEKKSGTLSNECNEFFYKFACEETGFYAVELINDFPLGLLTCYFYEDDGTMLKRYSFDNTRVYELEAGKTYIFSVYVPLSLSQSTLTFNYDATISYFGLISNIEITSYPTQTTYIEGYETETADEFKSYFEFTDEEWAELIAAEPSLANGFIFTNFDGCAASVSFSNGETFDITYNEYSSLNEKLKEPLKLGTNTVYFEVMGTEFSFDVEVIKNPVDSIKITNLPEIGTVILSFKSMFDLNETLENYLLNSPPLGSTIEITYNDGRGVVEYPVDENFTGEIDGYYVSARSFEILDNTILFTVRYLDREATYEVEYEMQGLFKEFFTFLNALTKLLDAILSLINVLSEMFGTPIV